MRFILKKKIEERYAVKGLKARRKKLCYSLADISDYIGVSRNFIHLVESGQRTLSESQMNKLIEILGE